mmetsp:Transcript_6077/g.18750  ORF Transcript_6077/g.18750 Transcript_6077/m.18750 type:complete len:363 (-) Transcript_6077:1892-2980(-)
MRMSSAVHVASYSRVSPDAMATSAPRVQNMPHTTRTTMPGQSSTHWWRGLEANASIPLPVTSCTASNMRSSTSSSQRSTAPLARTVLMDVLNGTTSCSTLVIAVTTAPSKTRRLMPSKHLRRWGCTRVGSLVSANISRISSLDRKKKRGKNRRFFSRYAAKPRWTSSSSLFASFSASMRSGSLTIGTQPGDAITSSISERKLVSTTSNFSPSRGICFTMSGLLKIGSRYIHVLCTVTHWSSRSWRANKVFSQATVSSLNALTKGLAFMAWIFTSWSSSICWISSVWPTTAVPVSLYGVQWNTLSSHSAFIFASALRRLYSLLAVALTAQMASICPRAPHLSSSVTVNSFLTFSQVTLSSAST